MSAILPDNTAPESLAASLATLADIELPAPPAYGSIPSASGTLLVLTGLLVLAAALGVAWRIRRRGRRPGAAPVAPETPDRQALIRLETLRAAWEGGRLDDRETGFRLCALLRIGLGLAQLRPTEPPASADRAQWRQVIDTLQAVRYPADHTRMTAAVFEQAGDWLAQAARERPAGA